MGHPIEAIIYADAMTLSRGDTPSEGRGRKSSPGKVISNRLFAVQIIAGDIDVMLFFWDPMEAQPHDSDVKALLRLCVAWNIPMACDRATADFIMTSPFMHNEYEAAQPDYTGYLNREVKDDEK